MSREVSNNDDVIDSRDVIARIEELEQMQTDADDPEQPDADPFPDDSDEARELDALRELARQGEDYSDWEYGEAMIRDSYFVDYAQELAADIGYMDREGADQWPFTCIDWERAARELRMDYSAIDFDGVTYWIR